MGLMERLFGKPEGESLTKISEIELREFPLPQNLDAESSAIYAEQMLGNPLFKAVIRNMKTELMDRWEGSSVQDVLTREKAYLTYKLIGKLEREFQSYVTSLLIKKETEKNLETII